MGFDGDAMHCASEIEVTKTKNKLLKSKACALFVPKLNPKFFTWWSAFLSGNLGSSEKLPELAFSLRDGRPFWIRGGA